MLDNFKKPTIARERVARCGSAGTSCVHLVTIGPGYLKAWWGVVALGVVNVPISTGYKGAPLANQVNYTQPVAMVTDADLSARLDADLLGVDQGWASMASQALMG